jgi:hypothetical protein
VKFQHAPKYDQFNISKKFNKIFSKITFVSKSFKTLNDHKLAKSESRKLFSIRNFYFKYSIYTNHFVLKTNITVETLLKYLQNTYPFWNIFSKPLKNKIKWIWRIFDRVSFVFTSHTRASGSVNLTQIHRQNIFTTQQFKHKKFELW